MAVCIGCSHRHWDYWDGVNEGRSTESESGKAGSFISSYSYGWDTVQTQIEGIKAGVDENTTIDYEFMDTKRFRTDEWLNMFHDMLKYHLENTDPYDVVIVGR